MRLTLSSLVALLLAASVSLSAQWPKFREANVPRDEKGQVRIDGPAPRAADGKPDLSGMWLRADPEPLPAELAGLFGPGAAKRDPSGDVVQEVFAPPFPPDPKSPPLAAFWDIGTNVPGGLPLTPWAAGVKKQRMANEMKDNPDANCMPMGITQFHMQPQPRKIIQTPKLIAILYEANYGQRLIYMDGRALPKQGMTLRPKERAFPSNSGICHENLDCRCRQRPDVGSRHRPRRLLRHRFQGGLVRGAPHPARC